MRTVWINKFEITLATVFFTMAFVALTVLVLIHTFQDDVVGKCKVQYTIKSRHISGRPKVIYKTRNLTECSDRAQTDVGIHVHSYEEKVWFKSFKTRQVRSEFLAAGNLWKDTLK